MDPTTGAVMLMVLIDAFLVFTLLAGAFVVLSVGLMSKREEDRVGGRSPSDVGFLKSNVWPPEPTEQRILPALEDDESEEVPAA